MRTNYTGPRIFKTLHLKTLVECGEIEAGEGKRMTHIGRGWWLLEYDKE